MSYTISSIVKEFECLITIAESILVEPETKDLTIDQFLQLVLDIRNAERQNSSMSLNGRTDKDVLQ